MFTTFFVYSNDFTTVSLRYIFKSFFTSVNIGITPLCCNKTFCLDGEVIKGGGSGSKGCGFEFYHNNRVFKLSSQGYACVFKAARKFQISLLLSK